MKTKYFKKIDFWARELRLPLFWLPQLIKKDGLIFYKNSVCHLYYLNGREKRDAEYGYKFFTNKKKVSGYEKQAANVLKKMEEITHNYKKLDIKRVDDGELKKRFLSILGFLDFYGNTYLKTEEACLSKLETEQKKYRKLISELGKLRFEFRRKGEPIFYILLGVLLKETGKRFHVKTHDLFFYTRKEIEYLFRGKILGKNVIKDRSRGYAFMLVKNQEILLTGNKFKNLFKEVIIIKRGINQITGQVAMTGRATGKVHVILHNKRNILKEVSRFKGEEILVTEMTRPDTILACKKAVAIITDEGGITSHAAIISRELKIPCVIGTKIATQILKNGDLIEVDANHGIVNILKKK